MRLKFLVRHSMWAALACALGFLGVGRWLRPKSNASASKSFALPTPPRIVNGRAQDPTTANQLFGLDAPILNHKQLMIELQRALDLGEPSTEPVLVQLMGKMTAKSAPDVLNFLREHTELSSEFGDDGACRVGGVLDFMGRNRA
jgi:hypothetical protein